MSFPGIGELPRFGSVTSVAHRAAPVKDSTNPGTVSPARQGARRLVVDQTRSVSTASASAVNSDGQVQLPAIHPFLQGGLNVLRSGSMPVDVSGDRMRYGAVDNIDQGIKVDEGRGLPRNVHAGNRNFARPIINVAEVTPIATNHDGGRKSHISGVPTPVSIK